jgi:hypothetical protein
MMNVPKLLKRIQIMINSPLNETRKIEDARRNITNPMAKVDFCRSAKLSSTYILNVG